MAADVIDSGLVVKGDKVLALVLLHAVNQNNCNTAQFSLMKVM